MDLQHVIYLTLARLFFYGFVRDFTAAGARSEFSL